jgi:TPR repeat protein
MVMTPVRGNERNHGKVSLFEQASLEWDQGNKKKAFELFGKAAQQGDPSAQHNLGYFYDEGFGVEKNTQQALYWYKKAAKNGEICSCSNIAEIYRLAGNIQKAKIWLLKAVAQGDGDAALEMAKLYINIKGMDNLTKAFEYLNMVTRSNRVTEASIEEAHLLLEQLQRA